MTQPIREEPMPGAQLESSATSDEDSSEPSPGVLSSREPESSRREVIGVRPAPIDHDARPQLRFHRGSTKPRALVWYGAKAFWGHLRHFMASAIATDDVDSRDWMTPDEPLKLADRIARRLGYEGADGPLVDALGRDLWIDYVADTGDDFDVSVAVARLMFAPYRLPDPEDAERDIDAPRGDILFFGGDTAYPVATANEIHNRVVVPFNQVLKEVKDKKTRVLIGIPGNHDWYDGLDGFARMFRKKLTAEEASELDPSVTPKLESRLDRYVDWAESFVLGGQVSKQKVLLLDGYVPVQKASYWALPLTKRIHVLAVDRQLTHLDYRQRRFFKLWREHHPELSPWVVLPDPVEAFCRPSPTGTRMIEDLELNLRHDRNFVLSGDIHHYQRWRTGETLHVTAGGGGAFLHPAPVARKGLHDLDCEWPGARQCSALLRLVPWHVMLGRAGWLPHAALAVLFAPALGMGAMEANIAAATTSVSTGSMVTAVLMALVCFFIGQPLKGQTNTTAVMAAMAGALTGLAPTLASLALFYAANVLRVSIAPWMFGPVALVAAVFFGALVFGSYLALLTRFGIENQQAFTALGHPGFKHFVRLRVRADGSAIDGWVIGTPDPCADGAEPRLVDTFTWRP